MSGTSERTLIGSDLITEQVDSTCCCKLPLRFSLVFAGAFFTLRRGMIEEDVSSLSRANFAMYISMEDHRITKKRDCTKFFFPEDAQYPTRHDKF
jgi:hypothetical protein